MSDMRKLLESLDQFSQPMEGKPSSNLGISQGSEYNDSTDFESDVGDIAQAFMKIKNILQSPEWRSWMRATDLNYGGSGLVSDNRQFEMKVAAAKKAFDELYDKMGNLS